MENYLVISFYLYVPLSNPQTLVKEFKKFFKDREIKSRIYISEQGINGQMSALAEDAELFKTWLKEKKAFESVQFKIHKWHEHTFPRATVKYRKQLVGYDLPDDLKESGKHVSPRKWKEMLDSKDDHIHLDIRNDYEWNLGHFEGAEKAPCKTSRDFANFAEELSKREVNKEKPVMMSCTGGIRCEIFSAVLKKKGFKNVFQLEGGMINYGLQEGNKHFLGKLFVFDDRISVPLSEEEPTVIGKCHHCNTPIDYYYNCANMDCNFLFMSCSSCIDSYDGCCKESCRDAERLRPVVDQKPHKPFRKKYHYDCNS